MVSSKARTCSLVVHLFAITYSLDLSFPRAQFHIHGFGEPYRFDRNRKGDGILLYIRDDIPSNLIESKTTIEGLLVEINLRKKWLLC